jgi:hypothetical protein
MGQMKIAPDGVRGKLRRIGSIKSPIGTTEKIAAYFIFIRPHRTLFCMDCPISPDFIRGYFQLSLQDKTIDNKQEYPELKP